MRELLLKMQLKVKSKNLMVFMSKQVLSVLKTLKGSSNLQLTECFKQLKDMLVKMISMQQMSPNLLKKRRRAVAELFTVNLANYCLLRQQNFIYFSFQLSISFLFCFHHILTPLSSVFYFSHFYINIKIFHYLIE